MREAGVRDQGSEIRKESKLDKAFELVERVIGGEVVRMSAMAVMGAEMLKEQGAGVRGQGSGRTYNRRSQCEAEKRFNASVGVRIFKLREQRGVRLMDLAASLKITPQQLANYEAGRSRVAPFRLALMAHLLIVPVSDLVPPIKFE